VVRPARLADFYACFLACTLLFWDVRYLAVFAGVALLVLLGSGIRVMEMRRPLMFIAVLGFLFGAHIPHRARRYGSLSKRASHQRLVADFTIFGWQPALNITLEKMFFSFSIFLRVFSLATMTILIPYSLNPAQYGIIFRGLGLPDKIAYAMDLTMRFIPPLDGIS